MKEWSSSAILSNSEGKELIFCVLPKQHKGSDPNVVIQRTIVSRYSALQIVYMLQVRQSWHGHTAYVQQMMIVFDAYLPSLAVELAGLATEAS